MDVSIIIVNYNTKELTVQCVESIYEHTKNIAFEIIVVDNDSTDGSQEILKNTFPDIRLIESKENLGFGKANNLGAKYAKGEYLFLLNSDTILLNNAVKIFHDYYNTHKTTNLGLIGSVLLDEKGNQIHSAWHFKTFGSIIKEYIYTFYIKGIIKKIYLRLIKLIDKGRNIEVYDLPAFEEIEVDYVTGADIFIPAIIFNQFDGFDKRFFMYYEEAELQKRMSKSGLSRKIIKGPEIIHLEGGSYKKLPSNRQRIERVRSMLLYSKLHFDSIAYYSLRILLVLLRWPVLFNRHYTTKENFKYLSQYFKRVN